MRKRTKSDRPTKFDGPVYGTSFSPDSKRFVVTRTEKSTGRDVVQVWDANTREPMGPTLPLEHYVLEPGVGSSLPMRGS